MSSAIIEVRNVSKRYRIGAAGHGAYHTLRDCLAAILRPRQDRSAGRESEFWALNDVSFDVQAGEVLGIIGANGAGKSTLLKILSRITEPTRGEIVLRGRVASLLEVGTGFHPELTGRENIYLNGVVLGMKRAEVARKFDEIVAFSGVEKFLDTPVKRYSSGMYVRLAFAVAAHLDPEILIVDEVLAVGDAEFQKRCLGKMGELSREEGRTVIFVSHNMTAVTGLCRQGLVLSNGRLLFLGTAREAVDAYLKLAVGSPDELLEVADRKGTGRARIWSARFLSPAGGAPAVGMPCTMEVELDCFDAIRNLCVAVTVRNALGTPVFHLSSDMTGDIFPLRGGERAVVRLKSDRLPLPAGSYRYALELSEGGDVYDYLPSAGRFSVSEGDFYGAGKVPRQTGGVFLIDARWEIQTLSGQ